MSADPDRELFEYYQRYLWGPVDFALMQDNVVGLQRDAMAELHGAGLLDGGAVTPGTGMQIAYAAFDALNDDGYLCVKTSGGTVNLAAAHATLNRYDLIVARPLLEDNLMIARPEPPGDTVPLTKHQHCSVVAITGTNGASPSIPSKVAGDVILAVVYIPAASSSVSGGDINQTTQHEIGRAVRFADFTAKTLIIRARGAGDAITGYGAGSNAGVVGNGGASGGFGVAGYGGSTAAGGHFDGYGDGLGSDDRAIQLQQNMKFLGSNPAATTAFTNMLTPMLSPKAWGNISSTTTTPTINAGANVASASYVDVGGGTYSLRVVLAAAMANTNGIVLTSTPARSGSVAPNGLTIHPQWVNATTIDLFIHDGSSYGNPSSSNFTFNFAVFAAQ